MISVATSSSAMSTAVRSGRPACSRRGTEADAYDVVFNEDRAEFTRRDESLTTTMEVLVSAEDDAEVRRISDDECRHPGAGARNHLLCRTRPRRRRPPTSRIRPSQNCSWKPNIWPMLGAILATRRRRAPTEPEIWAAHLAVVDGEV